MTPKQRMLNAYRGLPSDRAPVAPEFWYYFPAKTLGVPLYELELEIPFWFALLRTFEAYKTEGWGIAMPRVLVPGFDTTTRTRSDGGGEYTRFTEERHGRKMYLSAQRFSESEPSWIVKRPVDDLDDLVEYINISLSADNEFDVNEMTAAHASVGEAYLLEAYLGQPFFDFIAGCAGFEPAIGFFSDADEGVIESLLRHYTDYQLRLVDCLTEHTPFESYMIGCSYSCASLIGPRLWRAYDKRYIAAIAERLHERGKLVHMHFHGRSAGMCGDFVDIRADCVCPFERGPGGDVDKLDGLMRVRNALSDRVTMNGNIHTVQTLIRGTPEDARREVREIKRAFEGSNRFIIGTGDQVGYETREDTLRAMIDEVKA